MFTRATCICMKTELTDMLSRLNIAYCWVRLTLYVAIRSAHIHVLYRNYNTNQCLLVRKSHQEYNNTMSLMSTINATFKFFFCVFSEKNL